MKSLFRAVLLSGAAALLLPAVSLAADATNGKTIYTTNCFSCHGATGKGDGPVGSALNPKPRDFSTGDFKFDTDSDGTPGSDVDLKNVITNGAGAYGGSPLMAPWGHLPEGDVQDVIVYIRSLKVE
jgi:mono/diheme cytochrome c family protein